MKELALVLLLSFLLQENFLVAAEKYKVIKVLGKISVKKTGSLLKQGDELMSTEAINFHTPDSKASVISDQKGRFVLAADVKPGAKDNIKSNLLPPLSNISTRSGLILNLVDLKAIFVGNFLILNLVALPIEHSAFPMNDSAFFFLSYAYKAETINKKLSHRSDTLMIIEKDIFKIDGQIFAHAESTEVKLSYVSNKKAQIVSDFNLICPNNDQLKSEVVTILENSKNKNFKEIVSDVTSYFSEFYGKTDDDNVRQWLKINFNLAK